MENLTHFLFLQSEVRESKMMALRTAERLLKELKPNANGMDNDSL